MTAAHQGATKTAKADTISGAELVINTERARFGLQHGEDVAAAKAAAVKAAQRRGGGHRAAAKAATAAREAAATKAASAAQPTQTVATQQAAQPSGSPQQVAEQMLGQFGWSGSQFSCLEPLWDARAAGTSPPRTRLRRIRHPAGAVGLADGERRPDWQTDAATQIRWGLTYIQGRYGSPCGAWAHEEADGWY